MPVMVVVAGLLGRLFWQLRLLLLVVCNFFWCALHLLWSRCWFVRLRWVLCRRL